MAGLLNVVPRYLPRYGMAPNWARARPLVLVYTVVAFAVILFLERMWRRKAGICNRCAGVDEFSRLCCISPSPRSKQGTLAFGLITLVFHTTVVNIIERPGDGIAAFFIGAIIVTSLVSRVWRSTELRAEQIEMDGCPSLSLKSQARYG